MRPFVREGKEEREPDFDYSDGKKPAAQLQDFERIKNRDLLPALMILAKKTFALPSAFSHWGGIHVH